MELYLSLSFYLRESVKERERDVLLLQYVFSSLSPSLLIDFQSGGALFSVNIPFLLFSF